MKKILTQNFLTSPVTVLLIAILFLFNINAIAQNALFTMTAAAGTEFGSIIGIKPDSTTLLQTVIFDGLAGGNPSYSTMVLHSNGKMYGTTNIGGKYNLGVLYEYNPISNTYSVLYHFDGLSGSKPQAGLCIAVNGKLLGVTSVGGLNNKGVIYEYDIINSLYTKKKDLSLTNGSGPLGPMVEFTGNGKFYFLCGSGNTGTGAFTGSIIEYDYIANSTQQRKLAFLNSSATSFGISPNCGFVQYGSKLYGTTFYGGVNNVGTLFEYIPGGTTITKKYDFISSTGANPNGTLRALNGKLYGVTYAGGIKDSGVVFEFDTLTSTFTKKADFTFSSGGRPNNNFFLAANNKFYGLTVYGGANNYGTIYEYNYLANSLSKKVDCDASTGGKSICSFVQNTDGKLYAVPNNGGLQIDGGTLISYDTSSNTISKKFDFQSAINGANPQASLTNTLGGRIFGVAKFGGINGAGILFEYFPTTNTYTKLVDFSVTFGKNPIGTLCEAPNGKLYGTTDKGGLSDFGTIFEFNPTGNVFTKKLDNTSNTPELNSFVYSTGNKLINVSTSASNPSTISPDGAIVEYDYSTNTLTKLYSFANTTGANPQGTMFKANNGKLYGQTPSGGANNVGVIYEFDHATNTYTKKIDLAQSTGKIGYAGFTIGNTNSILGVAYEGGLNGGDPSNFDGVLYEYNFVANTYTVKYNFALSSGSKPKGPLCLASNGKYYGLTTLGGANGKGVVYQYDLATNTFTKRFDLAANTGWGPAFSGFIEAAVGACINPTQPTVASSANNVCPSTTLTLTASGTLNDATQWSWYTGSCGGTLIGAGTTFTVAPTVTTTYYVKGTGGCTSGASCGTITITVKPKATSTLSITSCNPYTWTNGVTYSVSGTYTQTISGGGSNGCDSIATLVYVKKNATSSVTNINSCLPYTWTNGTTYSVTATANQTLVNAAGCDSIATLNFTRKLPSNSTTNITSCNSFTWVNGTTYTTSTVATYTLTNAAGCDSVLTLNFTRKQANNSTTNIASCIPYTWTNGTTYSATTIATQTLVNTAGCDSIATLNFTRKQATNSTTNIAS
ncbi:MAG: hypothetical protein ORN55_02525, partial [Chitinophagaceae bacterium]|nr:hypothetical protein [Chitinophagaceae bacterium]